MARQTSMTLTLPPFRGTTRRVILVCVCSFVGLLILRAISAPTADLLENLMVLHPDQAVGPCVWQLVSYPFINHGILSVLLACLSLWFFASALEEERGSRWLAEFLFASTAGGGLLLCLVSRTVFRHDTHGLEPGSATWGLWPAVLAVMLAFAYFHPDQEVSFNFLFRLKAKYLIAIYLFIYLAMSLSELARMHAANAVCGAVAAYLFLRFAPVRGIRGSMSERLYGLRNAWYRRKRQRAARKFTVYMKKQGKDVNLDASGRYISLEQERRNGHDRNKPDDKRWMN